MTLCFHVLLFIMSFIIIYLFVRDLVLIILTLISNTSCTYELSFAHLKGLSHTHELKPRHKVFGNDIPAKIIGLSYTGNE